MTELLLAFAAGVVSHKGWRAVWRARRTKLPITRTLGDEFAPPDPPSKKAKPPRITEVA